VRWFFAMNHYRSRVAFSEELVAQAAEGFRTVERLVRVMEERLRAPDAVPEPPASGAYASLRPEGEQVPRMRPHHVHGKFAPQTAEFLRRFRDAMDDDLGTPGATAAIFGYVNDLYAAGIESEEDLASLLAAYRALTAHLWVLGIEYADERLHPELAAISAPAAAASGPSPAQGALDRLVALRQDARKAKDFAKSDAIRDLLAEAGVRIEDTPRGPRWTAD
jgi:cysteinyl-tRNA synthetase